MHWTKIFFDVFGGLGLFLLGMKFMSEGMQKVAGSRLRKILHFLTSNRFLGVGVGALVTMLVQSSSATTVMVVGFVNAELLNVTQAIGVILGANIGTTVTGWIVTLKIVSYSLPMIGTGVMIRFVGPTDTWKYLGEVIFGFGMLFLGMSIMSNGFAPLREYPAFVEMFMRVSGESYASVLFGVLIGTFTTLIVQSSSATTGITIALAAQGMLTFQGAIALVLGINIGTTITAILASIGTNHNAKRAALAHTLFNILGVVLTLMVFYPFCRLAESLIPGDPDLLIRTAEQAEAYGAELGTKPYIGRHIAMAHTLFNVVYVILFLPFTGFLATLVQRLIPDPQTPDKVSPLQFAHIHQGLIRTPAIGIIESEKELVAMARRVRKNSVRIHDIMVEKRDIASALTKIEDSEQMIDDYRRMITEYLLTLSQQTLSHEEAVKVGNYMTCAHNLEKYADYVFNSARSYAKMKDGNIELSDAAKVTIRQLADEIEVFYEFSITMIDPDTETDEERHLEEALTTKRRLKDAIRNAKIEHFQRLQEKTCQAESSMYFIDLLSNLDGMVSQVFNISETLTGHKFSA